jgi:hypothetical protein
MGKLVGAFTMIMGILVIAMPISVISANCSQVMADWYEEKTTSAETRDHDLMMVTQALEGIDPQNRCRQILIEVFDDDGVGRKPDFLGECSLAPDLESKVKVSVDFKLPLQQNHFKATTSSSVKGQICGSYEWDPEPKASGIQGDLRIILKGAQGLANADWLCFGMSDPFVVLSVWPDGPDEYGVVVPVTFRSRTCENTVNPEWDESTSFHYHWPDLNALQKSPSLRKLSSQSAGNGNSSKEKTKMGPDNMPPPEVARGMVPQKVFELEASLTETKQMLDHMYRHMDGRIDRLEALIIGSQKDAGEAPVCDRANVGRRGSEPEVSVQEDPIMKSNSHLRAVAGSPEFKQELAPLPPDALPGEVPHPNSPAHVVS